MMWSIFSNILATDTLSVASLKSDLRSVTIIAVSYLILWKIVPRYNGTWLY